MEAPLAWTIAGALVGAVAAIAGIIAAWASVAQLLAARASERPAFAAVVGERADVGAGVWHIKIRVVRYAARPRWRIRSVAVSNGFEFTLVASDEPAPTEASLWVRERDLERWLDETQGNPSIGPTVFVRRLSGRSAGRCRLLFACERENGAKATIPLPLVLA